MDKTGHSVKMNISIGFRRGMLRMFDICGASRQWPDLDNPNQRDLEALREDWKVVGGNIFKVASN